MSESKAVAALTQILGIVQNYLSPDSGMTADDALGQIIAVVDQWPLDGEPQLPAIPVGWEGSWRWMRHPTWNHGKPIPVQTWREASTGKAYYRPFDCRAQDFEWALRSSDWEEIAPAAEQKQMLHISFEAECHAKDLAYLNTQLPPEKYESKDWREGCLSERIQWLITMYEEARAQVCELDAQLETIEAGGVEPLRKRECLHRIEEPQQIEPVAWRYLMPYAGRVGCYLVQDIETANSAANQGFKVEPLYTCPAPVRGPLTKERMAEAIVDATGGRSTGVGFKTLYKIGRSIEAAHGITKEGAAT